MFFVVLGCLLRSPLVGLIQPGQCLANSNHYHVYDWTNSTSHHLSNPIVYDGADHSCIDEQHLQSCDSLRTDSMFQLSAELLVRHFKTNDGVIFPSYFCLILLTWFTHFVCTTFFVLSDGAGTRNAQLRQYYAYMSTLTGFILALFIFLSSYSTKFMFIESCNSIMVSLDEAAVFCRTLTSCGLTLASVYSADGTSAYGYSLVIFIFGMIEVAIQTCHLPLMLLHHWHTCATLFEANRLAILSKQGDVLSAALATALSIAFLFYYLTDWKHTAEPRVTSRATSAVYSPIATTDSTSDRPCLI